MPKADRKVDTADMEKEGKNVSDDVGDDGKRKRPASDGNEEEAVKKIKLSLENSQQQSVSSASKETIDTQVRQVVRDFGGNLCLDILPQVVQVTANNIEKFLESERLAADNKRLAADKKRDNKRLARLAADNEKMSLAGSLKLDDEMTEMLELRLTGRKSSHKNTGRAPAVIEKGELPIKDVDPDHMTEIMKKHDFVKSSYLLSLIAQVREEKKPLQYNSEHDVQVFVHDALRDALSISNLLFKHQGYGERIVLSARREAVLDSNIFDHTVVYDQLSGVPVFDVESKKPVEEPLNDAKMDKVHGQLFEQVYGMITFGHTNPFAALTTFEKTSICWIDSDDSQQAIASFESDATLEDVVDRIGKQLVGGCENGQNLTQSAVGIEMAPPRPISSEQDDANGTFNFKAAERKIKLTESFNIDKLVAYFVNAILLSLDGFNKIGRKITKLNKGTILKNHNALKLTANGREWGVLNIKCSGEQASGQDCPEGTKQGSRFLSCFSNKQNVEEEEEYYLIDLLGVGSTSRAFRAVTKNGDECVVKMYIRRYDENKKEQIERRQFLEEAEAAVKREVEGFRTIYGELRSHVFHRVLDGDLYCVIHPFFEHIPDDERVEKETLTKIESHLREKFANDQQQQKFGFQDEDMRWRHVGRLNGQLYLFDLADLVELEAGEEAEYVQRHMKTLRNRLSKDSTTGSF